MEHMHGGVTIKCCTCEVLFCYSLEKWWR